MIWVLVSSVLVVVAYVGAFFVTGRPWDAAIAGGVVSLVYLVGILVRISRPPMPPRQRWWIIGLSSIVIIGTILSWAVSYRQTNYQSEMIHKIRKVIHHGIALAMFQDEGKKIFAGYVDKRGTKKKSLGAAFHEAARWQTGNSALLETEGWDRMMMFAASIADTEIVLIIQDSLQIDGENPHFKNFDGRTGMVQDRLRITTTGFEHEIQN